MAAGDLITADGQVEIRGVLTGDGTEYQRGGQIGGLGVPAPKAHDVDLGHADGAYLGRDYTGVRVLTIPYAIEGATPAAAGSSFVALSALWVASQTDIPLHLQLPGFGRIFVNGRPRGLVDDLSDLSMGLVRALASFHCGDPTLLLPPPGPPTSVVASVPAAGNIDTTFVAPANTGGRPITSYTWRHYRASDNVLLTTVSNFVSNQNVAVGSGVAAYVKVQAINDGGPGPESAASNTVTP